MRLSITRIKKMGSKRAAFNTRISDENGFQVGMGMGMSMDS